VTVFVSAGEASGDAYGAAFVSELRRLASDEPKTSKIEVLALGGSRLDAVADRLVADTSTWGAISFIQSAKTFPRVIVGVRKVPRLLAEERSGPALAVPIDFGFFNVRFARRAKREGWKTLAFIPPGSWRRERQAAWAPQIYDAVSTPFPWSAEILTKMGTPNVHWFGHPLKQLLRERIAAAANVERLNQVAVLPGSRKHELTQNLPLIAASIPDLPAEFALATGTDPTKIMRRWRSLAPGRSDRFTVGDTASVLLRSRAAIVCSGTATLEAALCRCPMVVIYALSAAMHFEVKLFRLKRPKYVALPNILLDRMMLGEFVAEDAKAEKVRPYLAELLSVGELRKAQLAGFEELDAMLGPDDAITRTARLALEMLTEA
jgi:lipid-A-disaccharide synthase